MEARLSERLAVERRRRFVGRVAELGWIATWLDDPAPRVAVLWVHGPAGVGKTALANRILDLAGDRGVATRLIDARDVPPFPSSAREVVLGPGEAVIDLRGGRQLLVVDTYEQWQEIDDWVRRELLPGIPANTLVVVAGRYPPGPGWRSDPGWAGLVHPIGLRNLAPDESRAYLRLVGVAEAAHEPVLRTTHGFPLALALVAEVAKVEVARAEVATAKVDGAGHGGDRRGPEPDGAALLPPDLVHDLLDRLLDETPTAAGRAALEACAVVRVLTEPLLGAVLGSGPEQTGTLFAWLRGLSIVQSGPRGLFPHDLAREVLETDLRWRDPARLALLHHRAREYYLGLLGHGDPLTAQEALLDLMHLHTGLRYVLGANTVPGLRCGQPRADEVDAVVTMVARHEGESSAVWARAWLETRPQDWSVVRRLDGAAAGAFMFLRLDRLDRLDGLDGLDRLGGPGGLRDAEDPATGQQPTGDPAVVAARRQLAAMPALRDGEVATHVRFWLSAEEYQDLGEVQNLIAAQLSLHYLTMPGLAVTFLPVADGEAWAEFCAYADQERMPAADFTLDGRTMSVFGHDWRARPPGDWLALLAARETGTTPSGPVVIRDGVSDGGLRTGGVTPDPARRAPGPDGAPGVRGGPGDQLVVLSKEEFAQAVRSALRDLHRRDHLRRNVLCRSRLVARQEGDPAGTLHALVVRACSTLDGAGRDDKAYRALERAYLKPAASHELAAELLGLPSSTFRRHLAAGVARVTDLLWDAELGQP